MCTLHMLPVPDNPFNAMQRGWCKRDKAVQKAIAYNARQVQYQTTHCQIPLFTMDTSKRRCSDPTCKRVGCMN